MIFIIGYLASKSISQLISQLSFRLTSSVAMQQFKRIFRVSRSSSQLHLLLSRRLDQLYRRRKSLIRLMRLSCLLQRLLKRRRDSRRSRRSRRSRLQRLSIRFPLSPLISFSSFFSTFPAFHSYLVSFFDYLVSFRALEASWSI